MNCTKFQELAAAHALGALDRAEASRLEAIVAADPDAREELESFQDTVAALASVLPVRPPASDLRGRILERIDRTAQGGELENAGPPASAPALPPGFHFVPDQGPAWTSTPIPGLRVKALSVSRDMGYQVRMLELAPGGRLPEHDHGSSEDVLVLSGHLHTEGRMLGPHDFLHAEPGTHHGELMSPDGCVALIINRAPVPV